MNMRLLSAALLSAAGWLASQGALAYEVVEVKNGGTITGKVTFSGKDPDPQTYLISKDPQVCGQGARQIDFVKVNNGSLAEAVVFIYQIDQGKPFPADLKAPVIDQKGCEFRPYLSVMRDGDTVTVLNSDGVLHNVHLFELIKTAKRTIFNMNHPADLREVSTPVSLNRGTAAKIECDAHDFMHGFIFVAQHPYFAVVGEDGSFRIDNVPPGEYKMKAWHPTLGEERGKISVGPGGSATINFDFK